MALRQDLSTPGICLFRKVTGIPCPSCGTVHSVFLITRGEFLPALRENPLGYAGVLMMVILPLWIAADLALAKNSFYNCYVRTESWIKRRYIAVPLIVMILAIWTWKLFSFFSERIS
jgi:hypothetical protein